MSHGPYKSQGKGGTEFELASRKQRNLKFEAIALNIVVKWLNPLW